MEQQKKMKERVRKEKFEEKLTKGKAEENETSGPKGNYFWVQLQNNSFPKHHLPFSMRSQT